MVEAEMYVRGAGSISWKAPLTLASSAFAYCRSKKHGGLPGNSGLVQSTRVVYDTECYETVCV